MRILPVALLPVFLNLSACDKKKDRDSENSPIPDTSSDGVPVASGENYSCNILVDSVAGTTYIPMAKPFRETYTVTAGQTLSNLVDFDRYTSCCTASFQYTLAYQRLDFSLGSRNLTIDSSFKAQQADSISGNGIKLMSNQSWVLIASCGSK